MNQLEPSTPNAERFEHRIHLGEFVWAVVIAALLAVLPIQACGPLFPSSVLQLGDAALLEPHFTDFRVEIGRIRLPTAVFHARTSETNTAAAQTFEAEIADLRQALSQAGELEPDAARVCAEFDAVRQVLREHSEAVEHWKQRILFRGIDDPIPSKPAMSTVIPPVGLPGEFADYLAGSIAFHLGETNAAREAWERLLSRPPSERRLRSTWAAFMLGKTWIEADSRKAKKYFQETRELAKAGFKDVLGLAAASYGWEARVALSAGEFATAIRSYLLQNQTGDPTALISLRMTIHKVLIGPASGLEALASDSLAQQSVTAYLVTRRFLPENNTPAELSALVEVWLDAVERAGVTNIEAADRLALAAYQRSFYDIAERWLARANPDKAMTKWLRAKLLLRAGNVEEAAKLLKQVVRLFPREGDWPDPPMRRQEWDTDSPLRKAMGELGMLWLARRQYYEALDALLRSGYWSDAAYVAEYVLTPDELAAYVERQWPAPDGFDAPGGRETWSQGELRPEATLPRIRWLTGRRLARLRRWDEAAEFFPTQWKGRLEAFVQAIQRGRGEDTTPEIRAEALFEAAQIARSEGLELFGTEVEPDWALFRGDYDWAHLSDLRTMASDSTDWRAGAARYAKGEFPEAESKLAAWSPDEGRRIEQHRPVPNERFHYRYIAADLAWEAAQSMPDNSSQTAHVLWTAGTWMKNRDLELADRFYKALVRRCGQTALGKEADRLRWFPKTESVTSPIAAPHADILLSAPAER